jgi:hypothetical protein
MLVGASLSHPGQYATKICPSVAAVVSSIDDSSIVYPGKAQLQPIYLPGTWKKDRILHTVQSSILEPGAMLREGYELWKQSPANEGRASDVVVFRNIDHSQIQTINYEITQTARAIEFHIGITCSSSTDVMVSRCGPNAYDENFVTTNRFIRRSNAYEPTARYGAVVTTTKNRTTIPSFAISHVVLN